jgi:dTMP kinase
MRQTYGKALPGMKLPDLAGKLLVLEGTDCAGRTTQIDMLRPWLEQQGHAVLDTGMARSSLAGEGIRRAKEGNNLGRVTQSLFYATDFVDRLENEVIPALRAGFIVLTDRYIYSLMARAIVRGMDPAWIRGIYSAALIPDAVFYLRVDVEQLIPRVIFSRGFDYWESGMDVFPGQDMYESFRSYQAALLAEFDKLSVEFHFETLDASADAKIVFAQLQAKVQRVLDGDSRREYLRESQGFDREYLHKVFEYAAAATMRRRPEQAVVEPREAMAGGQNWAASPVSSHGLPRHDAGFFHRK